jgi:hypothetical protein
MNYEKLHNKFIKYCQTTTLVERLMKRNKFDKRLESDYIYSENHHILPKHSNGLDNNENFVILLPEEHLFVHKLRWKAYKERGDMLAVRRILNGFNNKTQAGEKFKEVRLNITKQLFQSYIWIKQNSSEVRKTHGWQSEDGRKRISEARKGMIPVVDKTTGKSMGCVRKTHPKYISGEWVHHSSGYITMLNMITNKKEYIKVSDKKDYHVYIQDSAGIKNSNYSGITDEEIVENYINEIKEFGEFMTYPDFINICNSKGIKTLKSFSNMRFSGLGFKELIRIIEEKINIKYNPYRRGQVLIDYKNKLKEYNDKN